MNYLNCALFALIAAGAYPILKTKDHSASLLPQTALLILICSALLYWIWQV